MFVTLFLYAWAYFQDHFLLGKTIPLAWNYNYDADFNEILLKFQFCFRNYIYCKYNGRDYRDRCETDLLA